MINRTFWGLLLAAFLFACKPQNKAQNIVNQSIEAHGGSQLSHAQFSFDFRKKHIEVVLNEGHYVYESILNDSIGRVHDKLSNEGFSRSVNGNTLKLSEEDQQRYGNTLNSVVYFALLPYHLNDPAANKELLGETTIKGEPYYEIKVTFDQEGGGTDHDDVFVYWIHQTKYTMDYLAYSFQVNGGGTRFREAYNIRHIEGIRFAHYINYESTVQDFALEDYESLFEEGKVEELSRIRLENVEVSSTKNNTLAKD